MEAAQVIQVTTSKQSSADIKCKSATKVTLTNWKRVANCPFDIAADGSVQAVHWCDYVVLFDFKEREMFLYHHKWGMWSSVNTSNDLSGVGIVWGCPLAVLNQDLILLSSNGEIYKFILEIGHWKVDEFLRIQDDLLENYSSYWYNGSIRCNNVVLVPTFDQQSLISLLQNTKNKEHHLYLKEFHASKWSGAKELQKAFLPPKANRISYALNESNLYVSTDSAIYCINTNDQAEKIMVTEIRLPSLAKFTICGANDTIFSFGGRDQDDQPNSDVSRYNPATNEWEPAGYMRSCRYSVTVTPFLRDKENKDVIVVGGILGESKQPPMTLTCRIAEICEVGVQAS